jgi:hypothetical protein
MEHKMKLNPYVAAAVAAALAGSAYAANPGDVPAYNVYISGASASSTSMQNAALGLSAVAGSDGICDETQQRDLYRATVGSALWTASCVTRAGITDVPAGVRVNVHKSDVGGSFSGVVPVAESQTFQYIANTLANCDTNSDGLPSSTRSDGVRVWDCGTTTAGGVPDIGTSDTEPELFKGINVGTGQNAYKGGLTAVALSGLVFNTPVSLPLRNRLQHIQFPGTVCDPAVAGWDTDPDLVAGPPATNGPLQPPGESAACMPSLSPDTIRGLFAGNFGNWNALRFDDGTGTQRPITDAAFNWAGGTAVNGGAAPTSALVRLCRRVNGSGTQAVFNAVFMNNPCATGVLPPTATSNPLTGPVVTLGSGSSNVDTCLDDAGDAGNWAIGIQSTERNFPTDTGTTAGVADPNGILPFSYRFIAHDGNPPRLDAVHAGAYQHWALSSLNRRTTFSHLENTAFNNEVLGIFTFLSQQVGPPAELAQSNTGFIHKWGPGGFISDAKRTGVTTDQVFDPNNPVAGVSRIPASAPNTCQLPFQVRSVQLKVQSREQLYDDGWLYWAKPAALPYAAGTSDSTLP